MGDYAIHLVTSFQSIQGDTISERKKNFNKLLKDVSLSTNKQIIHSALHKLEPKTYLESLFKVDALIYFRDTLQLLEIMKQGNEVFISKILKQNWFFVEVFENMVADNLVNDFLPCLSFAMRMKVLKRLSLLLNEKKMDEIYTGVYQRYGLWIATKILHTCTKEKLESVFNSEEITLRAHQVLYLFKKNTELFEMYIDYYKKTFDKVYDESKILNYIAIKNPVFFIKLEKQERIGVWRLGRRTTKKIYVLVKDEVSKDFDRYQKLLYEPVLIKKMGTEFKTLYFQRFPREPDKIGLHSECRILLQYYPKNRRWELFKDTFLAKFPNIDLNGLFSTLGSNITRLNMTRDNIVSWAEYNYQNTMGEEYLRYLPSQKAIPLIKEKINVTSDMYDRRNYVILLLRTCHETNDLIALEQVLNYICYRHRNEDAGFKRSILANLNYLFKLQELKKNHWDKINEIIHILKTQNEFEFSRFAVFLRRYLEFLDKTAEDYEPRLLEFLKLTIAKSNQFKLCLNNPGAERRILCDMPKYFSEIFKEKSKKEITNSQAAFIRDVIDFSEKYPTYYIDLGQFERLRLFLNDIMTKYKNDQITNDERCEDLIEKIIIHKKCFPQCTLPLNYDSELVDIITRCRQRNLHNFRTSISLFILKTSRDEFENLLLKSYFDSIRLINADLDFIKWFLKYEPTVLIPYWNKIIGLTNKINFEFVKLFSHLDFDKQAIQISKSHLENNTFDNYVDSVEILRILLSTDEFVALIDSRFVPTKAKLDLEDENMKILYDIQCQIAKKLYKVVEPFKMLGIVRKFTIGDYLQSSLPSLHGVFYRSPEKLIYYHVDELADKAVSVRKHAIFLSCEVLKKQHVMKLLTFEDPNISSQKHLFTAALKYFRKNPSQDLLNLVVKNMSTIDKNDTESLEGLVSISMPKKYKGFYIEKCWAFYESMKASGIKVDKYLCNLLENISRHTDVLLTLSSSFIDNIITNYFCVSLDNKILVDFIFKILLNSDTFRSKYVEQVVKKISTKKQVIGFVVDYLATANMSRDFLIAFAKHWSKLVDFLDNFKQDIMIKLLLFYSDSKENLAQNIILYVEELIEKFTYYAFDLFKDVFRKFLSQRNINEKYQLLYEMIKVKTTGFVCILILFVIHPIVDTEDVNFKRYQSIIKHIKNVEEPIVKIYFKNYMKQNNLE